MGDNILEDNKDQLIELENGHYAPRSLSYSRINKFLSCALAYKYKYVDDKEEMESKPAEVGTAVHEVLEKYFKTMQERGEGKDVEYMEEILYDKALKPEYWNEAYEICTRFARNNDLTDAQFPDEYNLEKKFALDKSLEPVDFFSDEAIFRGILDFVSPPQDDYIIIKDFKTNQALPPQSKIQNDLQLGSYAWMLSKMYPDVDYFDISLWFVRYNHMMDRTVSRGEIDHIEKRLMGLFDELSRAEVKEEFEPTISQACSWCDFSNICPEYNDVREQIEPEKYEIGDQDEAKNRAERYKMLNRIKGDIKGELEDYIEQNEHGIETQDEVLTYHENQTFEFNNPKKLFLELVDRGLDTDEAWEAFNVPKTNIKSVLKKHDLYDELDDIIDEVGEEITKTRFGFKDKENI